MFVEKKDHIERLILRRGRDIFPHRKIGEKVLQLFLAGEGFWQLPECGDVMTQPMQLGLLCCQRFVLATDDRAGALKGLAGGHGQLLPGSFIAFNVYPSLKHSSSDAKIIDEKLELAKTVG